VDICSFFFNGGELFCPLFRSAFPPPPGGTLQIYQVFTPTCTAIRHRRHNTALHTRIEMPLQRRLLSVASRLERGSIGKRHLHQAIPALPPSSVSRHLHGRAPQSGRPLLSPRRRRFATSPLHCEKAAQGATGPTSSTQSSSTSSTPFSEPSPPSTTIYTYEDIVALTESPDPNRILIGAPKQFLHPFPFLNSPKPPSLRGRTANLNHNLKQSPKKLALTQTCTLTQHPTPRRPRTLRTDLDRPHPHLPQHPHPILA
jgi:hypothetical protein